MTGSNVAEQLQRYSIIPGLMHGDFTFAATESELRKMSEWYDVKVRRRA